MMKVRRIGGNREYYVLWIKGGLIRVKCVIVGQEMTMNRELFEEV
jgi:hypothetical protein